MSSINSCSFNMIRLDDVLIRLRRTLVIIGDGSCGKTSLLCHFILGYFPSRSVPAVFENFTTDCRVDGRPVQLTLCDTPGQEDNEALRLLTYVQSHVVIIGFSLDSPVSLANVRHKWVEEVKEQCLGAPIILVGLKKDLREDINNGEEMCKKSQNFVTPIEGAAMAKLCGASKYLECSSLTGEGVDGVFEAATRAVLLAVDSDQGGGGCCTIQ